MPREDAELASEKTNVNVAPPPRRRSVELETPPEAAAPHFTHSSRVRAASRAGRAPPPRFAHLLPPGGGEGNRFFPRPPRAGGGGAKGGGGGGIRSARQTWRPSRRHASPRSSPFVAP